MACLYWEGDYMKTRTVRVLLVAGLALLLAACGSYYKVTDPTSGRIYYTKEVDKTPGGAIRFEDAGTGSEVTLQSSEVKQISSDEFDGATEQP
jgi:hypothetical protein